MSYVVSSLPGRARLRHPLFRTHEIHERVMKVLQQQPKIYEIREGSASLLLRFDPSLSVERLCQDLEAEIPALAQTRAFTTTPKSKVSLRTLENRALLISVVATCVLGFVGSSRAHVVAGVLACALSLHHVWTRRKAL